MIMYDFILVIYFISLAALWSHPFCKGATHWIVTEDGKIQQQADSIFNLKSPHDLVTFIHQQSAYDRLKILREEYLEEKRRVIEVRETERAAIQKSFYKEDPDCADAGKHISEFKLHLDMTVPLSTNGINIPDHVNLCQPLPSHFEPPYCRTKLPTVMYSYDHLEGVNGRHQLNTSVEPTLFSSLSSYFKTVEDLGGHVSLGLKKNSSSWVLLNLAAYYWRIKGNALEAVECLRRALYFSPWEHNDHALLSLAAVLYHANHSLESLVLLHTAMETGDELSLYHFLLGNIYASLKMYEMADLCYRFMLVMSPDTETLCERVKGVRCELKLKEFLNKHHLNFDESLDSLKTPELDLTTEPGGEEVEKKRFLPVETYKTQLNQLFALVRDRDRHRHRCKSRAAPLKQELHMPFDHSGPQENEASEVVSGEAHKFANSLEESKRQTKNKSAGHGVQTKTLETSTVVTESNKITSYFEADLQKFSESKDRESSNSVDEKVGITNEILDGTNSPSDNHNISTEEKTMQNLQEARLALNRLNSVIRTVSRTRHSAASTVNVADETASQSSSNVDSGDGSKTVAAPSRATSAGIMQTVVEKQRKVKPTGDLKRLGRRGETGVVMPKRDSDRTGGKNRIVSLGEVKFTKRKGESVWMADNGPGLKLDETASKNAREFSDIELTFNENPKGGRPFGPKHTPPLESKDMLVLAKKCHNFGTKKRKGEASAMECLSQDMSLQTQSSSTANGFIVPHPKTEKEFSKSGTNLAKTESVSQLQSDAEPGLVKKTVAEEISTKSSPNAMVSDQSPIEAKVQKNAEEKNVENGDKKSEEGQQNGGGENSNSNEVKNRQIGVAARGSEMVITRGVEEIVVKENSEMDFDSVVDEKSELKISSDQDSGKNKTSRKEGKNIKETSCSESRESNLKRKFGGNGNRDVQQDKHVAIVSGKNLESKAEKSRSSKLQMEQVAKDYKSSKTLDNNKESQNIKEIVKEAEFLHKVGAGSNVFETNFMNVRTSGALHELSDEECKHIEGVHALVMRNKQFSAWLSLDTKNIDVRTHIDFLSEVNDFDKRPRCTAKIKSNLHTFSSLQGVISAGSLEQVAEAGLTQTLLTVGRTLQGSIDEMGTRIFNALKKNSTSWVLLNIASLYWRVQGDTAEAIRCLQQALSFSPPNARDIAHVGLSSILLREGHLDDTAMVIKKALEISPSLALGHFILGNVFGAQSNIPDAIQHYLLALQLEPGFTPAVERLKIIQCVLWKQQKALEKEANDLRKLLTRH